MPLYPCMKGTRMIVDSPSMMERPLDNGMISFSPGLVVRSGGARGRARVKDETICDQLGANTTKKHQKVARQLPSGSLRGTNTET